MNVEAESDEDDSGGEEPLRPTSIIVRFLHSYLELLDGMQKYWKSFDHYFMVLCEFALIGDEERQLLLSRSVPAILVDFYLGEESPVAKVKPFSSWYQFKEALILSFRRIRKRR